VSASGGARAENDRSADHERIPRTGHDGDASSSIFFASEGVDMKSVIIGHSCGSSDLSYHVAMLDRGCTPALIASGWTYSSGQTSPRGADWAAGVGYESQLVLSHDTVAAGSDAGSISPRRRPSWWAKLDADPTFSRICAALKRAGVGDAKTRADVGRNPRRYSRN